MCNKCKKRNKNDDTFIIWELYSYNEIKILIDRENKHIYNLLLIKNKDLKIEDAWQFKIVNFRKWIAIDDQIEMMLYFYNIKYDNISENGNKLDKIYKYMWSWLENNIWGDDWYIEKNIT